MTGRGESPRETIRRLERENRILKERERDFEERWQAPADIEGVGNKVGLLIYRHKNMGEVEGFVWDLVNVPSLRPEGHPEVPPLGFRWGKYYVRTQVPKMVDSMVLVASYNTALVRDRHRIKMFIRNRAGKLIRPDVVGDATRADLIALIEDVAFAPSVPHLFANAQETEVQPVEAERKGFG
jgi:hypothetical protein